MNAGRCELNRKLPAAQTQDYFVFLLSGAYFPSQLPAACCPHFNDTAVGKTLSSAFLVYVSLSKSILLLLVSSHVLPKPERNVGWDYF